MKLDKNKSVFIAMDGMKFHKVDCRYVVNKKFSRHMLSCADAIDLGYFPCKVCFHVEKE